MSRQSGLALVLVLTVLLALILIATPFVLSMVVQERTATTEKEQRRADYGADGARNQAVWRLMHGHDMMERRFPAAPWDLHYADTLTEFQIRPTIADPKGSIWGITVQDEQGKINLTTAPQYLIDRFAGTALVDSRILDPKDYLTMYSVREARWIYPQRIRSAGSVLLDPNDPNSATYTTWVDDLAQYGLNARLRVSKPGLRTVEVIVNRIYTLSDGTEIFETNPRVPDAYVGGIFDLEARHPVNFNTAPLEVLTALFTGLRLRGSQDAAISPLAAAQLARRFYKKPADRLETFLVALIAATEVTPDQRLAVAINAINPLHRLLGGTGTMPFVFRSFDVVTIEAYSSVNAPSGVQTAGRGFREVVSVAPPTTLAYELESQYDFESQIGVAAAFSAIVSNVAQFSGYPFGSKILTSPNVRPTPSDTTLKPRQSPPRDAWFQCAPARDDRGTASIVNWREHFDSTLEGQDLRAAALVYPWTQIFATYPQGATPPEQMPDAAAGGVEFWIRFDAAATFATLFDLRQSDTTNRISVHYDVSTGVPELVLTLADGTLGASSCLIDNGVAQIRFPFAAAADRTWYHVGAYWKGTRYAHGAVLVDGFASPSAKFMHYSPEGNRLLTTLRAALTQGATTWTLSDNSMVPTNEWSYWLVGGEVIAFDPSSNQIVRGMRGTTAQAHPAEATVQIFGYSSKLRNTTVTCDFAQFGKPAAGQATMTFDRVTMGGGSVAQPFGTNPTATVNGDKTDPNTNQTYVDATQSNIPVTTPDINEFPPQGHIVIEDEVIYYTAITPGASPAFTGCVRGQHGTAAAQHNTPRPVRMWGIAATDVTNYLSPTVIQIGAEWFGPVYKDPDHPNHWIGHVNGAIPGPLLRGAQAFGSVPSSHVSGDRIIPVWAARESDLGVGRLNIGTGDRVTITDDRVQSEYKRIMWAGAQGNGWTFSEARAQLAAFLDDVPREYVADDLHVRVLKFPSGEILGLNWLQTMNPSCTIGPAAATIDELKAFASPKGNFQVAAACTASDRVISMNNTGGISATGGAIKIGDEIVGFTSNQNNTLQAVRGYLGSGAQVHDAGDLAFNMSFLPIATLTGAVPATSGTIVTTQGSANGAVNRTDAYMAVQTGGQYEVLMYTGVYARNNDLVFTMPGRLEDSTVGMFRGMFGTAALNHSADTLAYFLPYRFWDTYKARQWDGRMCWFEAATCMESAQWRSVRWTEDVPANDPNLRTHALVRVDGKGEWFDAPGRDLFEFVQFNGANGINRVGRENDAGQLELRFQFEYAGGFWPEHSWKRATRVKSVRVEYVRPTRTLHHEDR
ncbi:MAG: hypothetical protein HYY17_17240 [Planctomycetes bacterium]|nr:hypothetical protein [Planctomycetota bacterium]